MFDGCQCPKELSGTDFGDDEDERTLSLGRGKRPPDLYGQRTKRVGRVPMGRTPI